MSTQIISTISQVLENWLARFKKVQKNNKILSTIALLAGIGVFYRLYWSLYSKLKKLPPGPIGLPYFGSFFQITSNPFNFLQELPEKYGPLVYCRIGVRDTVFINDSKLAKDLFPLKPMLNRPYDIDIAFREPGLVGFINGSEWIKRRKIIHDFFVVSLTNENVTEITKKTLNDITFPIFDKQIATSSNNEIELKIDDISYSTIFNILYIVAFGTVISVNDENYKKCSNFIKKWFTSLTMLNPMQFLPISYYLISAKINLKQKLIELNQDQEEIFGQMIEKRKLQYDPKNCNGFIDSLVHFTQTDKSYTTEHAILDISVIFSAGIDTTAKALEIAIYCAAMFPNIQEEVYNELLKVAENHDNDNINNNNNKLNNYKWYSLKSSDKCPKLKAFLHESLRYIPIVPLNLQHSPSEDIDVSVNGKAYIIPKNSIVLPNMEYLTHDKKTWGDDAEKFSLNRWLISDNTTDQTKFKLNENELIFGVGRRDCVGKSLALKDFETTFANWILNYSFRWNDKYSRKIKKNFAMVYQINPVPVIISKRC